MDEDVEIRQPPEMELSAQSELRLLDPPQQMQSLTKEPYAETVFHRCDEQARQRAEMRLRKQAAQLGFQLLPIPATGQ